MYINIHYALVYFICNYEMGITILNIIQLIMYENDEGQSGLSWQQLT